MKVAEKLGFLFYSCLLAAVVMMGWLTRYKLLWSDSVIKPQLVPMYLESVCDLPSNVLARFRAVHSPRSYGMKWIEAGTVTNYINYFFKEMKIWYWVDVDQRPVWGIRALGAVQDEEWGKKRQRKGGRDKEPKIWFFLLGIFYPRFKSTNMPRLQ